MDRIEEIFKRFQKANPDPKTELNYTNTFTLLVAVVMSAQATDKGVNRATEELFKSIDTPEKMVDFGEEALRQAIRTIGLYRTKAKNVIALSALLLQRHEGIVPSQREALEALPGVGRKTANVVLSIAFGKPYIAVDTHIFRVSKRLGLAAGKDVRAVEDELMACVPKDFLGHAHHWLILHGRYVCKARKPECEVCFLRDLCPTGGGSIA